MPPSLPHISFSWLLAYPLTPYVQAEFNQTCHGNKCTPSRQDQICMYGPSLTCSRRCITNAAAFFTLINIIVVAARLQRYVATD